MSALQEKLDRPVVRRRGIRDITTVEEAARTLARAYRVHAPGEARYRAMRSAARGNADAQAFWLKVATRLDITK